jgi:DNA-binding transcriptional regulator LsrR (DeoR family)
MSMNGEHNHRLEEAARAAWLYYIAGNTQDEIAIKLDISRQVVQRLVALAVNEKLIKFQLNHPIAKCMELAARLAGQFELEFCDVVPTDPVAPDAIAGVTAATAVRFEKLLSTKAPIVLAIGTGLTLRTAVEQLGPMERPQHKLVSLVGSMTRDGRATSYEVVMRLGDKIGGQRFPMPMPVLAETVQEREILQAQRVFTLLGDLRAQARASIAGIGEIGWNAPLHRDGFLSDAEIGTLIEQGAVGEITGWSFDAEGRLLEGGINARLTSLPLEQPLGRPTIIVGNGSRKIMPLHAALRGGLLSGLITDEATAAAILAD